VIAQRFSLSNGSSVYEVGCGAGALLYGLRELLDIDVGGCDFASPLISIARHAIPKGDFIVSDATKFPLSPPYDVVLANGVFHYFPDLMYARRVVELMAAKARRAIAILEIPDEATRELSEQTRREMLSPEEYEQKYRGLDHLYFPKSWFRDMAEAISMECTFPDIKIPGYAQSSFRFGVLLSRRDVQLG
jgi:trans-aconitate methyltransferase